MLPCPPRQSSCRPDRLAKGLKTWLDTDRLSRTERWRGCCRRRVQRWTWLQGTWGLRRERWLAKDMLTLSSPLDWETDEGIANAIATLVRRDLPDSAIEK
jgi:hypothetical protein